MMHMNSRSQTLDPVIHEAETPVKPVNFQLKSQN